MLFETLKASKEGAVLFIEIAAPPMNLLGPELVRDSVPLIFIDRAFYRHLKGEKTWYT
jgi:hypothetical protein